MPVAELNLSRLFTSQEQDLKGDAQRLHENDSANKTLLGDEKGLLDWMKDNADQQAAKAGKKEIGVMWIDIDKGDATSPDYRSRLVVKDFKTKYDARENLYAATLPLEAL